MAPPWLTLLLALVATPARSVSVLLPAVEQETRPPRPAAFADQAASRTPALEDGVTANSTVDLADSNVQAKMSTAVYDTERQLEHELGVVRHWGNHLPEPRAPPGWTDADWRRSRTRQNLMRRQSVSPTGQVEALNPDEVADEVADKVVDAVTENTLVKEAAGDGAEAEQGVYGPPGPVGEPGAAGQPGPQGGNVIGLRGLVGPAGPQGEQGPEGRKGRAGPQGPQGVVGSMPADEEAWEKQLDEYKAPIEGVIGAVAHETSRNISDEVRLLLGNVSVLHSRQGALHNRTHDLQSYLEKFGRAASIYHLHASKAVEAALAVATGTQNRDLQEARELVPVMVGTQQALKDCQACSEASTSSTSSSETPWLWSGATAATLSGPVMALLVALILR